MSTPWGPPPRNMGSGRLHSSAGAFKEKVREREYRPAAARGAALPYAELRMASAFSFLDGASLPEDLVARAAELGLPAVALVDRQGVYGAPRFYKAAKAAGLRALVGAEVRLRDQLAENGREPLALPDQEPPEPRGRARRAASAATAESTSYLTLLVENRTGYRNLCKLLTAAARGRPKGEALATWEQIAAHAEGLHVLSGGEQGTLAAALDAGGIDAARALLERLAGLFPGRLHLELQRHHLRVEEQRNQALLELGRGLRLPLVATNGVRYARAPDKRLHDVLTCIRHHTHLDAAGSLLAAHRERHCKDAATMARLFADLPRAVSAAAELATRLDFTLADLGYRFPDFPLPPGETAGSYLRQLTWNGARARFRPLTARAQSQLEKELALIEKLDLAGYFLIVWDIVRFCRESDILAQGRGSAANSAVCYALSITAVDPVKMELLFERFLSEERGEWPDIDLDLPSGDQRERVIQYVYRRYGTDLAGGAGVVGQSGGGSGLYGGGAGVGLYGGGAAMTANVITYRDRSAAREVAKALGYSAEQVDRLAKQLGSFSYDRVRGDDKSLGLELAAAGLDPEEPRVRLFGEMWQRIQNLPRHLGQHSGGMVIAAGRLDEVVPLEPAAMPGRTVVQWDKDDCADLGLIKVDLLGLGMLQAIEQMIPLIRAHEGVAVDLAHLPADDPAVYAQIRAADTVGVFQIESRAQMASLPRHAPTKFYDLVIQVAIIRPGPIMGGMIHPFFERRMGRQKVEYPHPCLEPILKRTLGVPIFQEQILRMAMEVAGFTGGEAEELRRAMGFKRSAERMRSIEQRLRAGMTARGIVGAAQEQIVLSITSFALYGFPESHAASFALIAYASAWLRCHHPTAFTVALLNAWPMGFYHPATLVSDAQHHGVEVRPVDVNASGWECRWEPREPRQPRHPDKPAATRPPATFSLTPPSSSAASRVEPAATLPLAPAHSSKRGRHTPSAPARPASARPASARPAPARPAGAVRIGLRYVRGLRQLAGEAIAREQARRPFSSVEDLQRRCGLRAEELRTLAEVGALGSLGLTRRAALWQVGRAARPAGPLFDGERDRSRSPLPEMTPLESTAADYAGASLTTGPHPMAYARAALARQGIVPAAGLLRLENGRKVRTAGSVIVRQRPGTAKGMLFLTLEDETGMSQAIVTPDLLRENRRVIVGSGGLIVEGTLQRRDGTVSVKAERFWPIGELASVPSHDFR